MKAVNLGILGVGTVGSGVLKILTEKAALLEQRVGAPLRILKVAGRRASPRVRIPPGLYTTDAMEIVKDSRVDIVVELIGGTTVARSLCLEALNRGKHLVTANKALLAEHGLEIYQAAATKRVDLGFEASVCGAIPIIRCVREGLVANSIRSIVGIVNGTTNYILTEMTESGRALGDVLAEAQAKGIAEADPSLDVDGLDAAHKLQILASAAYGGYVPFGDIHVEGIRQIDALDIAFAREFGCVIKLLAVAKVDDGELEVHVHPTVIPDSHPLASIGGSYNGLLVHGDAAGPLLFSGLGAGQMPTASSVVADIAEIAHNIVFLRPSRVSLLPTSTSGVVGAIRPVERSRCRFYLRFMVQDKPGVLSAVSGVLAENEISIASMIQKGRAEQVPVPVVMLTHDAVEGNVQRALARIGRLDMVAATVCLRVEGLEE